MKIQLEKQSRKKAIKEKRSRRAIKGKAIKDTQKLLFAGQHFHFFSAIIR